MRIPISFSSKGILSFAEKNVQWLAIALGLGYVGWMTWTYVVSAPITLALGGGEPMGPGEVDPYIDTHYAQPLAGKIAEPGSPEMPVPSGEGFIRSLSGDDINPQAYALNFDPINSTSSTFTPLQEQQEIVPASGPVVAMLPTLPQATIVDSQGGRSSILPASNGNQPPPANASPTAGQDCIWAAVKYSIPIKQLQASFDTAGIPPLVRTTTILQVTLVRQELGSGDEPIGPEVEVKPLGNIKLAAWPASTQQAEEGYRAWADKSVGDILQPPFYQVLKGDVPFKVIPPPPFDPAKVKPDDVASLTPEQKQLYVDYQKKLADEARQQAKQRIQNRPQSSPPPPTYGGPPPGYGGPRGGGRLVADAQRDTAAASGSYFREAPESRDPNDNGPPPGWHPPGPPGYGAPPGYPGGPYGRQGYPGGPPDMGAQGPASGPPLPPGKFSPNQVTTDIVGWAYDDSVKPAHVYRYRVVYKIQNPIWLSNNIAKDPSLAQQFDLSSETSDPNKLVWTPRLTVPSLTTIFMASNISGIGDRSVRIKVAKWQNGEVKVQQFEVEPGDTIGKKQQDGDYVTPYVLVDAQPESDSGERSAYILLMDERGDIIRHEWRTDQPLNVQLSAAQ